MLDGRWREGVDRGTVPVGDALRRVGVTANQLTVTGLVMAVGSAIAIGSRHLLVGGVLMVASGLPDLLDGPVAKAAGQASRRGAFLDSVADRITDCLLFGGVTWYLIVTGHGRVSVLPVAVLAAASIISYERAKAESLGFHAKGGLMERAERLIALGIGLFFGWLIPVLWFMLALTVVTAIQRFVVVWRQASAADSVPSPVGEAASAAQVAERRWRQGRVDSRWRSWRQSAGQRSERRLRTGAPAGRWRARRRAVSTSRASRASGVRPWANRSSAAGRPWRPVRTGRHRVSEALRRRVDGGQ